jgi:hypothetical protein
MKIRRLSDFQTADDHPSISVNLDINASLEGVTSQSTSQLMNTAHWNRLPQFQTVAERRFPMGKPARATVAASTVS